MNRLDPIRVPLSGTTLIEASAGTGKTYTIATLFLRLLLERKLTVGQILVVTFTRAATGELRDRIRRRLHEAIAAIDASGASDDENLARLIEARRQNGELAADRAWLQQALRDFDEAAISTIHAFCQRTLTEHAFESQSPFELELLEQQAPLIEELSVDYWAQATYAAKPELIQALRAERVDPELLVPIATKAVRDPRMPVLPDPTAVSVADVAQEPYLAARANAAELWARNRERIVAALCVPDRLPKKQYPADKIRSHWAPQLDALRHLDATSLPDFATKLTPDKLLAAKLKNAASVPSDPFFDAMAELCARAQEITDVLDKRVLGMRRGLVDYARAHIGERRAELGVRSFDDLLHALRAALEGDPGARLARRIAERYPAALIDEVQDTDPVQYEIFQRLYTETPGSLFLIGDPKQAIYAFRGADVFAYVQAARAIGKAVYTLDVNRRSDPRLVTAINTLFSRARRPFLFEAIEFSEVLPKPDAREQLGNDAAALQLLLVPAARANAADPAKPVGRGWAGDNLPRLIAGEIVHLLDSGATLHGRPIEPRDIAVLCRKNKEARDTQAALAALGVPTVLDGDSSVFESEMAEELSRVLWAIARSADARKLGAALASSILGVRGEALQRLRADDAGLEPWLESLARWNQLWHERGFMPMLHALLDEAAVQRNLLVWRDGERRLTDLLHLGELLHDASVQQRLGPLSLLHWFTQMRKDPNERSALGVESPQLRLEHDEHALKLTTIHRSKGLEYPIVFCPFSWGGVLNDGPSDVTFHDAEDSNRLKLDLGSQEFKAHEKLWRREELSEGLRLLYVALTRAKHRCYVVWGRFNRARSALGYLLHQGPLGVLEPEAIDKRIEKLSDAALRAELGELCAAADGAIGVRELRFDPPEHYVARESSSGPLAAREAARVLRTAPRMSSFSRLTASEAQPAAGEEALDHDALGTELPEPAAPDTAPQAKVVLHAFPAGARPGTLIHSVFENIDFTRADGAELEREVTRLFALYGLAADPHAPALIEGIDRVLRTPLDRGAPPLVLGDVARDQRLNELEFTLSTEHAAARLTPARLADVFERFAAPAAAADYPTRLRLLRALPPSEFLKGFIDLVFRHGERYFVVDYKSNWLGAHAADYAPAQLAAAMGEHHYFLQYHLYSLALHRYLTLRLPGYDYERCFGGVYYLFVRGMAPEHAHGSGVFFDRPQRALLDALGAALGEAEQAP